MDTIIIMMVVLSWGAGLLASFGTYVHRRDIYSDHPFPAGMHAFVTWLGVTVGVFVFLAAAIGVVIGSYVLIREAL